MDYSLNITYARESDGTWVASIHGIKDASIIAYGRTKTEAKKMVEEAFGFYLENHRELNDRDRVRN
jgi:predicted RNase H-like HicB family nuclease